MSIHKTMSSREAEGGGFPEAFEFNIEPRRRLLSLPDNLSGTRHYHVHEHHYYMWGNGCQQMPSPHMWGPMGRAPWQMRQWNSGCSSCSSRSAWAPPWVFEDGPWTKGAGRFSLAGGLLFLVLMAICRGGRVLLKHIAKHSRPALPPAAE